MGNHWHPFRDMPLILQYGIADLTHKDPEQGSLIIPDGV